MKNKILNLGAVAALAFTTSCATMVAGTNQEITVTTTPPSDARCILEDAFNRSSTVIAPGAVQVRKGSGPLRIKCDSGEMKGDLVIDETMDEWFTANLFNGIIPGMAVDGITGAYQKFPESVNVNMEEKYIDLNNDSQQFSYYEPKEIIEAPAAVTAISNDDLKAEGEVEVAEREAVTQEPIVE